MPVQVTSLLDDVESLLKDLECGHKSPKSIELDAREIHRKIKQVRADIESGALEIRQIKTYWIFWLQDSVSIGKGDSVANALTELGYGGGAAAAIDYYMCEPVGAKFIDRAPTIPDGVESKKFVMSVYTKGIREHFAYLYESVPEKDYVHALEDFYTAYNDSLVLTTSNPEEKAVFMEIHLDLVKKLNPSSRHGKMYFERFFERSEDGALHQKLNPYPTEDDKDA